MLSIVQPVAEVFVQLYTLDQYRLSHCLMSFHCHQPPYYSALKFSVDLYPPVVLQEDNIVTN